MKGAEKLGREKRGDGEKGRGEVRKWDEGARSAKEVRRCDRISVRKAGLKE